MYIYATVRTLASISDISDTAAEKGKYLDFWPELVHNSSQLATLPTFRTCEFDTINERPGCLKRDQFICVFRESGLSILSGMSSQTSGSIKGGNV